MRCPKCRTLTLVPAGDDGGNGRLVRCPRCAAAWVSRAGDESPATAAGRPPMIRRGPLTIEGDFAARSRARTRSATGRAGLLAAAAVLALALAAIVTLSPGVSARPDVALTEASR